MRRKLKSKHVIVPDREYDSVTLSKFINNVMESGKKNTARKIVYGAFEEIKKLEKEADPIAVFDTALKNVGPNMEVRSRRVGGANYQIPREVRPERKNALAMRWIIEAAKKQSGGRTMQKRLAEELISASKNEGEAVKKRENVHKMAEANRAFAHFAW